MVSQQRERLENRLREFVAAHTSCGHVQRSAKWYELMNETFGGSEMAALLNMDPYKKRKDVIASKLGINKWNGGSVACWWGKVFEDVVTQVVEIDCGTEVLGDELTIMVIPRNRYSPDGYCVIGLCDCANGGKHWQQTNAKAKGKGDNGEGNKGDNGESKGGNDNSACNGENKVRNKIEHIWTTSCDHGAHKYIIVLIETKSAFKRIADGKTCRQYKPQLWTGLAVSPLADRGLFLDAQFRKCSLQDLSPTKAYDKFYHADKVPIDKFPFAWGLIGVYAPRDDAPLDVRIIADTDELDSDISIIAWRIASQFIEVQAEPGLDIIDFGESDGRTRCVRLFDQIMGLIDQERLPIHLYAPCLEDGRGADLHSGKAIDRAIVDLRGLAPEHHYLLGVIPWKLFELNYVFEERKVGFEKVIKDVVEKNYAIVEQARQAEDPESFLREWASCEGEKSERSPRLPRGPTVTATAEEVQELFDSL